MPNANEKQIRTQMILGENALNILKTKRICLLGVGGVGGHCAEALARCGVGHIHIIDNDTIAESNMNRQLVASKSQLGRLKTDVIAERINDVSDCSVTTDALFLSTENIFEAIPNNIDFIIDAIDTVSAKLDAAQIANERSLPIVSCMGMGNRLDPTLVRLGDVFSVQGCPLARVMRRELKKRGMFSLMTAYSLEKPIRPDSGNNDSVTPLKRSPGSTPFVPAAAGIAMAYHAVKELITLP